MDNLSRVLATRLGKEWGQSVLVVNKPAPTKSSARIQAKSPADGYTLFAATEAALTMNPHLYKKLPYNPERTSPHLSPHQRAREVLRAQGLQANTLKEFIQAGQNAKGHATDLWLLRRGRHRPPALGDVRQTRGLEMVHVPYKTQRR